MREDMKHVVIDRPRTGGDGGKSRPPKGSKRRWQRIPVEDHPRTESSARRRRYGWHCKELSDHLSPLRRWLRKQCGRHWDDVYAEICSRLRTDSVIQAHVRDHVNQDVLRDTRLIDGVVCDSKGEPVNPSWRWRFYVDPRNGALRATERRRWRHPPSEPQYVAGLDERYQYWVINGIWYEMEFAQYPADGQMYGGLTREEAYRLFGRYVYPKTKRQLGKVEIRRRGLWDTPLGKRARAAEKVGSGPKGGAGTG